MVLELMVVVLELLLIVLVPGRVHLLPLMILYERSEVGGRRSVVSVLDGRRLGVDRRHLTIMSGVC